MHKLLLSNALGRSAYSHEYFTTIVYAKLGGLTECIMGNWKIENVNQNSTFSISVFKALNACAVDANLIPLPILVPRGPAPFGQHQESRPLARSKSGSPRFTDFPSLCACSEKGLTNLIASGLNLLCLQIHSKPECSWTGPEVADQKKRGLWGRECPLSISSV